MQEKPNYNKTRGNKTNKYHQRKNTTHKPHKPVKHNRSQDTRVYALGGLNEIVEHGVNGMKSYTGNPNSIADSVLSLLFDPQLAMNVTKNAKNKVKDEFNWQKIAQDTHYIYELAISKTIAQRQAEQLEQEKAKKTTKARNTDNEVINLLKFRKRHAYA